MKLNEMPIEIQEKAANLLCQVLVSSGALQEESRKEKGKIFAVSIREIFEELFN